MLSLRQKIRALQGAALVGIVVLLSACATVPPPTKPTIQAGHYHYAKSHLDWMINKEMRQHKIMGISIALVANGEVVHEKSFGYADKSRARPVNTNTLFRAGSIAKIINALVAMDFVEQNKIRLEDPVVNHLPNFSYQSRWQHHPPITVADLLTHQSGLPSDLIKGMWMHDPPRFTESRHFITKSYLANPPNTVFSYSNLGHNVLGMLIEKVSGQPYEQFVNQYLLQLNMKNAALASSPTQPPTAQGYNRLKRATEFALRDVPAAGLSIDIHDMAQLLKVFTIDQRQPLARPLSAASRDKMFKDYSSSLPMNVGKRIGLGMFFFDGIFHHKVPVLGHNGASVNHRAALRYSPEFNNGVVLLSNSRNAGPTLNRVARKAMQLLHEGMLGKPAPTKVAYWPRKSKDDTTEASSMVGYYATKAGLAKIVREGTKLTAELAGRRFQLYQKRDGGLHYGRYKWLGIFPINLGGFGNLGFAVRTVEDRQFLVATSTVGNTTLFGEKITPRPISAAWKRRVGAYQVHDPLAVVDLPSGGIKIKDGFLLAYAKTDRGDKLEFALLPEDDHHAVVAGVGRGLGETVFVEKHDDKETLVFSNIVFQQKNTR